MDIAALENAIKSCEETYLWALPRIEHDKIMCSTGLGHFISDRRENWQLLTVVSEEIGHDKVSPRVFDILREIDSCLSALEKVPRQSDNPEDIKRVIVLMAKVHSLSFGAELYLFPLARPISSQ